MLEPTHAGGVVYRRTADVVEFLLVSARRSPAWVLPKGHIESGETAEQAAVREVEEEAGVIAAVERALDLVTFQVNGERQLIQFYLMPFLRETRTHEARQIAWLPRRNAVARLTFAEARNLIEAAALSLGGPMNATELIIELVLTGMLALAALLLPAVAAGYISPEVTAETLAIWVALGFVLGVIVDRCGDSILSRWMSRGDEGILKWLEQSRIRLRIARTLAVLSPALTTSAMLAIWVRCGIPPLHEACFESSAESPTRTLLLLPVLHLVLLGVCCCLAEFVGNKPRTDDSESSYFPGKGNGPSLLRYVLLSPATAWFGSQTALALWMTMMVPQLLTTMAVGALVTALGFFAWWRLSKTFMHFLWRFARSEHAEDLVLEMTQSSTLKKKIDRKAATG